MCTEQQFASAIYKAAIGGAADLKIAGLPLTDPYDFGILPYWNRGI
jgi:hypothetical protein